MNLIVAVDKNWGIGNNQNLLYNIPEDMEFFKANTQGKVVVMGDVTLKSLPGGKPLKKRHNVVISADKNFKMEDAHVCYSKEEVLEYIKQFKSSDVFIIGGAYVYKEFLPYCKKAFITKIDEVREANKFFPNVDQMKNWTLKAISEDKFNEGIKYNFCVYENYDIK